jgi:hypothetical protein
MMQDPTKSSSRQDRTLTSLQEVLRQLCENEMRLSVAMKLELLCQQGKCRMKPQYQHYLLKFDNLNAKSLPTPKSLLAARQITSKIVDSFNTKMSGKDAKDERLKKAIDGVLRLNGLKEVFPSLLRLKEAYELAFVSGGEKRKIRSDDRVALRKVLQVFQIKTFNKEAVKAEDFKTYGQIGHLITIPYDMKK